MADKKDDSLQAELEEIVRQSVNSILDEPYDMTGKELAKHYSNLSYRAQAVIKERENSAPPEALEFLIMFTKDVLHSYEMQAGWHVLSRFIGADHAQHLTVSGLAKGYVLEHRQEFMQKLYVHSRMFVDFIDAREDCILKLAKTGIVDAKDYLPMS